MHDPSTLDSVALFCLIGVLGWIGSRVHAKLDQLSDKMEAKLSDLNKTLGAIERDIRGELNGLDRRVTRVEAHCDDCMKHQEEGDVK